MQLLLHKQTKVLRFTHMWWSYDNAVCMLSVSIREEGSFWVRHELTGYGITQCHIIPIIALTAYQQHI